MSVFDRFLPFNNNKSKVLVGVPCRDQMYSHFAYCLQALVAFNLRAGIETIVEFNMGTLVSNQREKLMRSAFNHRASHILFLDSDMMFPANACHRLLAHNLGFVACNYSTRVLPSKSVAYASMYDWESFIPKDATGVIEVAGVGLGCALISTSLVWDMYEPCFPISYSKQTRDYLGEDMNFCQKVRDSKEKMYVDCDLSKEIYHLGTTAFAWNAPQQQSIGDEK